MARSNYQIAYVERGYEQAWPAYWVGGEITNEVTAAHAAGHLGRVEIIAAGRLEDAIALVRQHHPSCTVMREHSSRIGST